VTNLTKQDSVDTFELPPAVPRFKLVGMDPVKFPLTEFIGLVVVFIFFQRTDCIFVVVHPITKFDPLLNKSHFWVL
jgi:hypothetical protein